MYALGNISDFCKIDTKIFYLTPMKRKKIWVCNPVTVVDKAINSDGHLLGMVIEFKNPDRVPTTVVVERKLINKSGASLARKLASCGLLINPGYEKQLSQYISAKLETVKSKKVFSTVNGVCVI